MSLARMLLTTADCLAALGKSEGERDVVVSLPLVGWMLWAAAGGLPMGEVGHDAEHGAVYGWKVCRDLFPLYG